MTQERKPQAPWTSLAGVGLETGLTLVALIWIGHWADGCLATSPWLLLIALAMGLIATTYRLWRLGQRYFSNSPSSGDSPSDRRK